MKKRMRKHLSAPGLLQSIRQAFLFIKDDKSKRRRKFNLVDYLMSGLAIFSLKSPSLLAFDKGRPDKFVNHNLKSLYGVEEAPCDTQLREGLDEVKPSLLFRAFKSVFRAVQRGKGLVYFKSINDFHVISADATGVFNSEEVHCKNCCVKHHKNGSVSYYHQILSAVMVHPDRKEVVPLLLEPIVQQDGSNKNDCELNASKRLMENLRRMHPNLKMLILEDSLYSKAPHIKMLQSHDMSYIIGAKEADHKWMFDWVKACGCQETIMTKDEKTVHLRWQNQVPLNAGNEDVQVNFLECYETDAKGKKQHFTWVTNLYITKNNVYEMMRVARTRWKIENETFNTLKTQGYHFEHNFGHGKKFLSTVFATLMLLAFAVDQLQKMCCPQFQKALKKCERAKYFWWKMRGYFYSAFIDSWDALFEALADPPDIWLKASDTS